MKFRNKYLLCVNLNLISESIFLFFAAKRTLLNSTKSRHVHPKTRHLRPLQTARTCDKDQDSTYTFTELQFKLRETKYPIHKGVSLFLSYTKMNKVNSLHHVKEHPKIRNFLQFESHSSNTFKVTAISDLRNLYENKIQGLSSLTFMFYTFFKFH